MKTWVKQLIPSRWRRAWSRRRELQASMDGFPPGASSKVFERVGRDVWNVCVVDASYSQLSAWKKTGAFRVFLKTNKRNVRTCIYKVAQYSSDEIPALEKLPVSPGAPEYTMANIKNGEILKFLPRVYWVGSSSVRRYEYVFEDLSRGNNGLTVLGNLGEKDVRDVISGLKGFHNALEGSLKMRGNELLDYNYEYSFGICEYAREGLLALNKMAGDREIFDAMSEWKSIEHVYLKDEFLKERPEGIIHGDLNSTNVFLDRSGTTMKCIDWEWAGKGVLHSDLASLLACGSRETREWALENVSQQNRQMSKREHRRWYFWCVISRALLDAGFLARQAMYGGRESGWMRSRIRMALQQCGEARRELGF